MKKRKRHSLKELLSQTEPLDYGQMAWAASFLAQGDTKKAKLLHRVNMSTTLEVVVEVVDVLDWSGLIVEGGRDRAGEVLTDHFFPL